MTDKAALYDVIRKPVITEKATMAAETTVWSSRSPSTRTSR